MAIELPADISDDEPIILPPEDDLKDFSGLAGFTAPTTAPATAMRNAEAKAKAKAKTPNQRAKAKAKSAATRSIKKRPAASRRQDGGQKCKEVTDKVINMDATLGMLAHLEYSVAMAADVQPKTPGDALLEVYSNPRVGPEVAALGLTAMRSMDKDNGWDLSVEHVQKVAVREVITRNAEVLGLPPPCTIFSKLMDTNWGRMATEKVHSKLQVGVDHWEFAIFLAKLQMESGKAFYLENPHLAKSWQRASSIELKSTPGVFTTCFDQCCLGLVSKVSHTPIKKRTVIVSNLSGLHKALNNKFCTNEHKHCLCQGTEGGMKISVWAQRYPPMMCKILAQCVRDYYLDKHPAPGSSPSSSSNPYSSSAGSSG